MHFPAPSKGASLRLAAVSLVSASALVIGNASGVFAALTATADNGVGQTASSGTLKLELGSVGASGGITSAISNLAPGDSVIRYVDLTSSGTLDAQLLQLQVAATPATPAASTLITDGVAPVTTKALTVTVLSCASAWAGGVCAEGAVTEIASTPLSGLASAVTLDTDSPAAGTTLHLQVTTSLPDQTETVANGVIVEPSVQGKSATLVYTFSEAQRTALTTSN